MHGFSTEIPDELVDDVVVARACARFHKLPSEVLKENPHDVDRVMQILDEIDNIVSQARKTK